MRCSLALFLLLGLSAPPSARAGEPEVKTLPLGASAPDFRLPGVDGRPYTLADFASARLLVVVFTCNHCPTAQAYEQRIIHLARDYKPRGVAVVAINPNDPKAVRLDELGYTDLSDSFEEMKLRARARKFSFPYLYDGATQKTAHAYGVLATPHVFIFDRQRKLRYVGRVDDGEIKPPRHHDAINALEALLAGRPVPVPKTRVFGCSTKWADKRADARRALARWDAEPIKLRSLAEAGLKQLVQNKTKKLLLINVWETRCGPCVHELPEFVTMNRMYRGRPFRLVTISLDDPDHKEAVLEMLKKNHVAADNYLTRMDRDRFADVLDKSWEGPLPHTLLIAPGGKIIYRKTGAIDPLTVRQAIVGYLGRTY